MSESNDRSPSGVLSLATKSLFDRYNCDLGVLTWLKVTNMPVYLTGSRFFGTHTESSDYDFFVAVSSVTFKHMSQMNDLGFQPEGPGTPYSSNPDPSISMIMRYSGGLIQVHIQIIKDDWFGSKIRAQHKIETLYKLLPDDMGRKSKDELKALWSSTIVDEYHLTH